mgnify:CR=1 FL=1
MRMNRVLYAIILLTVIASSALAGVHAATHVSADASDCELCSAYNDPSDAITAKKVSIPVAPRQPIVPEHQETVEDRKIAFAVRQRAPPASV